MSDATPSRSRWMSPQGITWVSLLVNSLLTGAKIVVGLICRSQALVADAIHSGSDLGTDVAVLAGLGVSARPADRTHHYGHQRVSTLVAMIVGAALAAVGVMIIYEAIQMLHMYIHGHPVSPVRPSGPFWVALASAPIKEVMFRLTRRVGRTVSDASVVANAWHHRTDAFAAVATALGLGGVAVGGPEWRFLDPLTAIVLAAFLLVVSFKIVGGAASELIDRAPAQAVLDNIQHALATTAGVRSFHAFRARQLGGKVEMDVHVQVDPALSVAAGHDIAAEVRRRVREADSSVVEVIVHVEPAR
jgi:cation diffusion facilitator family transporter